MKKSLPKLTLHRASGSGRVRIHGRDFYCGKFGTPECHERYAAIVREHFPDAGCNIVPVPPSPPQPQVRSIPKAPVLNSDDEKPILLVSEAFAEFLKHVKATAPTWEKSGQPEVGHVKALGNVLLEICADLPITRLRKSVVRTQIIPAMIAKKWSRRYVNAQVGRLKRAISWLADEAELIPESVADGLSRVRGLRYGEMGASERPKVVAVKAEIVSATIPHLGPVVREMVKLIRLNGCRPGEARNLRIGHLDRSRDDVWIAKLPRHKNTWRGLHRELTFGPAEIAILKPLIENRDDDEIIFSPKLAQKLRHAEMRRRRLENAKRNRTTGRIQPSQICRKKSKPQKIIGDAYTKNSLDRAIQRACEVSLSMPQDLTREQRSAWRRKHCWNAGMLRHLVADETDSQYGVEYTAARLGHARVETSQIYIQRDRSRAIEMALNNR